MFTDVMYDNFGRIKKPLTKAVFRLHARLLFSLLDVYYEFPPIAYVNMTGNFHTPYPDSRAVRPLFTSPDDPTWHRLKAEFTKDWFAYYWFVYVHVRDT